MPIREMTDSLPIERGMLAGNLRQIREILDRSNDIRIKAQSIVGALLGNEPKTGGKEKKPADSCYAGTVARHLDDVNENLDTINYELTRLYTEMEMVVDSGLDESPPAPAERTQRDRW